MEEIFGMTDSGRFEPTEQRIDEIGEQFLESLRRGEVPDLDGLVRSHPELSPRLEKRLRFLAWMHQLSSSSSGGSLGTDSEVRIHCPHCRQTIVMGIPVPEELTCENCGRSFRMERQPEPGRLGEILPESVQRFRVEDVLGHGSFGVVYRAWDTELGRTVTLKVPRAGHFRSAEEEERFAREARSAARLSHPGIVRVYEVAGTDQVPCIVQEYIEGKTLEKLIRDEQLSFSRSVGLVRQVADALHYAHEQGVIHRDIKPENIIVDSEGHTHIADFGLARQKESQVTVTQDGQIVGTPAYMSPEQAAGKQDRVGVTSDVYSMGVILYEMLTGLRPFSGQPSMVLYQVLNDEPRLPRRLNEHIPRDLETICLKAIQKEPGRRYQSAGEFRDDLLRYLAGETIQARPVGQLERCWRWCRRNPVISVLTGAITLLIVGVAVASLLAAIRFQEKSEETSRALEVSRQQLVRINVSSARQLSDQGDFSVALPYLVEALHLDAGDPERELPHRIRIASAIARCPRLLHVWLHREAVSRVAFSPDGQWILCAVNSSSQRSFSARVYSLGTGQLRYPPLQHSSVVHAVQFSPDSRHILTSCHDGGVRIWDSSTGLMLKCFHHEKCCRHATYSPDGSRVLSVSDDETAYLWNVDPEGDTGDSGAILRHPGILTYGTFSSDGRRIAVLLFDTAVVWDVESGMELMRFTPHPGHELKHACFSPDGRRLATACMHFDAHLWDVETGKTVGEPMRHGYGVTHVAFSPDGSRLVTVSYDRGRIWNGETAEPLARWMDEQRNQEFAAFSPDGRYFVTTESFRTAYLWDAHTGEPAFPPIVHYRGVRHAAFHPDGHLLLIGSGDGMMRLWDLSRVQPEVPPLVHRGLVEDCKVSADGQYFVSACRDRTARVAEVETGIEITRFEHTSDVYRALFRPGHQQVLTLPDDGSANLWDVQTGDLIYSVDAGPGGEDYWTTFHPSGDFFAASNQQGTVTFWQSDNGTPQGEPLHIGAAVSALVFSPDGRLLCVGAMDETLRLLEVPAMEVLWQKKLSCKGIPAATFNRSADRLATGHGDGSVWIWDVASGERALQIGGVRHVLEDEDRKLPHVGMVSHVEFSPCDRYLLTVSLDGDLRVWDAHTGQGASGWFHLGHIPRARFSHDGRWIAAASRSQSGRVWDWQSGESILPSLHHDGLIEGIAFDPAGQKILTGSFDRTVKVWDISLDERPMEDLILLAQLQSGQRLEKGSLDLLTPEEIEKAWRDLRRKYPDEYSLSADQVITWHRREVAFSEMQEDWHGLIWHADRLLSSELESLPQSEMFSIRRKRIRANRKLGKYRQIAEDCGVLFEHDPREYLLGYHLAILSLAGGDLEKHQRACRLLLALSKEWDQPRLHQCAVRACILSPHSVKEWEDVVAAAKKVVSLNRADCHKELGAALYRAGSVAGAILRLNIGRLYYPKGEPQILGGTYLDHLFLAMAYHDQGLKEQASQMFTQAEKWIAGEIESGQTRRGDPLTWDQRLRMEILLEEARSHLGK